MGRATMPGQAIDRIIQQQMGGDDIEIGQGAERGTGEQGGATMAGGGDDCGDGRAKHDLGQ